MNPQPMTRDNHPAVPTAAALHGNGLAIGRGEQLPRRRTRPRAPDLHVARREGEDSPTSEEKLPVAETVEGWIHPSKGRDSVSHGHAALAEAPDQEFGLAGCPRVLVHVHRLVTGVRICRVA